MSMKKIRADVEALVRKELGLANQNNPPFNSPHEGWAVIREEVDELAAEANQIDVGAEYLWKLVKGNGVSGHIPLVINDIEKTAINAACEAIQVAAMCRKFLDMG